MEIYSDKKKILKRKRIFRIKIYFLFLLLLLLLMGGFYLATYSSLFKIKSISVENNKFLTNEEVLRDLKKIVLSNSFGGQTGFNNLWSWPSGKVGVSNPAISEIDISKNWFKRTVKVEVNERGRFAIWCILKRNTCYWIDRQGVVFAEAPLTEGSLVFTIFDSRENDLFLGSKVEENRFIGNLISILENFDRTGFEAEKITFDDSLQELHITTAEGPTFFFSIRFNSLKNLALIRNLDLNRAEYVDLTVDNKIFYKNKK